LLACYDEVVVETGLKGQLRVAAIIGRKLFNEAGFRQQAVQFALDFTPVGTHFNLAEAVLGKQLINGTPLDHTGRVIRAGACLIPLSSV